MTSRDGGYDLAHEALVRAWPRLRAWLDEDRVGQQIRRHLAMTAAGWEALDRPEGELYRGARLGAAVEWLERGHEPLAETERDFIEASRAVADDEGRRLAERAPPATPEPPAAGGSSPAQRRCCWSSTVAAWVRPRSGPRGRARARRGR